MKKNLLKSLLLALMVLVGGNAWAQTTTLMEYGTENVAWNTDNLAEWTAGGNPTITDGYVAIAGGNGSYSTSKTINPTENAIINVKAVWRGSSNTGRAFSAGNGSYFRFGNIIVAQNDQDKKHGYGFKGLSNIKDVTTFAAGSYRVDISECTWLLIEMEINTASNTLTSFAVKSEDGNTTYASAQNVGLEDADYSTIAFGYYKTGRVSTANAEQLKSVKVTQTLQAVETANYTVKFVCNDTEVKEASVRTGVVGQNITLNSSDTENFYTDNMKYIYVSNDAEGKTVAEGAVVTVTFREAEKFAWTAKSSVGTYSISGETWEGDKATVKYPLYQLVDGKLWTKAAISQVYAQTFDITENNQELTLTYTETEIPAVFYAEVEDLENMSAYAAGNAEARCSQRAAGYSADGNALITSLPQGKYKMVASFYSPTSAGGKYNFFTGNRNIWSATTGNANATLSDQEVVLAKESNEISLGQGSYTQAVDYIYIQSLGEPTSEELEAAQAADQAADEAAAAAAALAAAKTALQTAINEAKAIDTTDKEGVEALQTAIATAEAALAAEDATTESLTAAKNALAEAVAAFEEANKPAMPEIANADFSESTPIDNHLCGYGKDMAGNNTTYYGLQDITGWNKVVLNGNADGGFEGSGMGGAVFAYGSEWQMKGNNKTAPAAGPNGEAGNALGYFAVWGCGGYYYQDVTLPAGKYTLFIPIYNQSGTQANESYTGFFASDEVKYTVAVNTTVGKWVTQSVEFELAEETTGQIRLGYKSTGAGSAANPMIFIDGITIKTELDGAITSYQIALAAAKEAATNEVVTGAEKTALNEAIATYSNIDLTSVEAVKAATTALNAAVETFNAAIPAYQALADAKSDIQMVGYDDRFPYATEAKKEAAQATLNAVAKTAAEATTMTAAIYKAYRQFAESHAMAEGVEGAVNMTDAITNPKAESAIAEPWKVVLGAGSGGSLNVKNAEPWTDGDDNSTHKYFDGGNWGANAWDVTMKQDITLPAGKYLMTVKSRASDGVMFSLFAANDTTGMPALGASGCLFNRGWNDTSLEFEVKEAGTVNIGVQGVADTQHQWMSFSDFRLVQLEATAPAFEPAYGTLWTEEAQGSQVDENEFNYITLENKYFKDFAKVGDTIKVAISSVGNQPASSRPRIVTQGTLKLKIDDAGETLNNIQQDETNANLILTEEEIANIQKGADVVLSWKNMTVAQVDLIEKVEAVKTDYTDYIANADLTDSENKGWDDAGTKGIDGSGIVKASTGATFNFSQTITNLPAGKYKLTAQAAYRYSGSEADEYAAMQTDAITKFAQLYATVGTKNTNALVQNRYDGASDTDLAGEGAVQVNNLWVPNSSNAVKAWFAAGKYVNEVEFNLPADGDVKIGIVKTASPEAGDYTVIGPWTLTRLGDAEEEPEPETINPGDDVTKFIVNNSFETGDLTGWTVGSSSDTGVKPNSNGTYTTEGCDGDYLFNTWWQGIPITQTITNLPKGKYELKALMANDAITAGNKPCLYLLANGDHSEAFSSPNAGTFAEGTMEFYVTDGTATIGAIGGNADGSFTEAGYYWYKVDNFRLTFVEALPNIDDIEIPEGKMSNAAAQALADAKAAGDVVALLEAVKVAKASIEAYAHLNGVLNELTDILEKTNVYTAEAKQTFDTAFNTAQTGYNDGTISDADAKAFNYGSRLEGLLPSLLLSAYTSTVNGTPYINTWSVEGNNDGTNYLTPFFEYWVGDTESLAENTITATMDVDKKGYYDVTAWVRVRVKNGVTDPATGINLQVNNGGLTEEGTYDNTATSVTNGEQVGNSQFYLGEFTARGYVGDDLKLNIKFNVSADNNISWLAFKNVKFTYPQTVGINEVNTNVENNVKSIYNLNGQKVEKAKKGLYIINGKKVVLK